MIDDMYQVMNRIDEIKKRFGLVNQPEMDSGLEIKNDKPEQSFDAALRQSVSVAGNPAQIYSTQPADTGTYTVPKQYTREELEKLVDSISARNGISPELIRSMIQQESNFNPQAISPAGAMGLMQLMPETAASLNVKNVFDPEENLEAGIGYFKNLLEHNQFDYKRALAAYNAGQSRVDRAQGVPDIPETQNYVETILKNYNDQEQEVQE